MTSHDHPDNAAPAAAPLASCCAPIGRAAFLQQPAAGGDATAEPDEADHQHAVNANSPAE